MADYLNIAGRIRTTASDGVGIEAQEVKDLNLNKSQQEINADVQTELGDRYTKEETYSKEQLDNMITTPDVNYVSVVATDDTTAVTDVLPATGEANTIYRVGNWNGTQYDPTMYALFAWNGSAYVCLAVRSFVGEVYDISVNHPDGQGNPTPYADLAAALGTSGANIPAGIRRGGMSIKFIQGTVQSSDNKYVQYRLMAQDFTTDTAQWQGVDNEPVAESRNLVESGGVFNTIRRNNTGIFSIPDAVTKSEGTLPFVKDYYVTPFIDIDNIPDGSCITCSLSTGDLTNTGTKIQCYDANKELVGAYNQSSIPGIGKYLTNVKFTYNRSNLAANTKYIRLCAQDNTGFIDGLVYKEGMIPINQGFIKILTRNYTKNFLGFTKLQLNCNYYDYDKVVFIHLPSLSDIKTNPTSPFIFYCYNYNSDSDSYEKIKEFRFIASNGKLDGHVFYYNFDDNIIEFDYDLGAQDAFTDPDYGTVASTNVLTKKSFIKADYVKVSEDAYVTSGPNHLKYANSFEYVKYTTSIKVDVTVQRIPDKNYALSGNDSMVFYLWENDNNLGVIRVFLRDCTISGNIVTYSSNNLEFVFNYSDIPSQSYDDPQNHPYIGQVLKTDIIFTDRSFNILVPRREDIKNKIYVNLSSSTFSSYSWHRLCVTNLGMNYKDYGKGGASHYIVPGGKYNLDYQNTDSEHHNTQDRCTLNMVAKLLVDKINNGFYPDIIVSCCVLNDCYGGATIGTLEEALAATLPTMQTDTVVNIESTFGEFFDSEVETWVKFRNNSMKMMRLVIELLSQNFPYSQIIISSCQQVTNTSFNQAQIAQFNAEQKRLAAYYALPYINLNDECGINKLTIPTFLASDLLHPSPAGEILYQNYFTEQLIQKIALKR